MRIRSSATTDAKREGGPGQAASAEDGEEADFFEGETALQTGAAAESITCCQQDALPVLRNDDGD